MRAKVYCEVLNSKTQAYYLTDGRQNYYLFTTDYRTGSVKFFSKSRSIDEVLEARRHKNTRVRMMSKRLIGVIKYMESAFDLCVLRKTAKKKQTKVRSSKMLRKSEREYEDLVA